MIIDTHVHVWEIDPPRYPLGPTAPGWNSYPEEAGTATELLAEMDAHGVDRAVLVQTSWSTWDNGYIADSVRRFPQRFLGHGLLDPLAPDNAEQLRYWMGERGLVGFRFHPLYYPGEDVLLRPQNRNLWEEAAARGAILQFHLRPAQAHQLAELARCHPNLPLIIDHLGYPQVGAEMSAFRPILELAVHDNVFIKLSDVKGRSRQAFPFVDVHPLIQEVVRAYGIQRLMWGTGFPGRHRERHNWLSLADELALIRSGLPFLSAVDQERVLGGTAAALWGL